jgi:hypothetical protein
MIRNSSRLLLVSALLACVASAQTITWGPVLPSVSPTDVSVAGAFVFAGNAHQPGVPTPATVNGVTFAPSFQPTGWAGFITGGLNGTLTGDTEYDKLLGTSLAMQTAPAANPSAWGGIRLDNLATLVPGRTYSVQVWFTDQRTGSPTNVLYDRVMNLSSAFGAATLTGGQVTNLGSLVQGPVSGGLEADPDNAPATTTPDTVFGSHCTGTFTYDPTNQLWLLIQGTHPIATNVLAPHITALQIRDLSAAYHQAYGTGCYNYNLDQTNLLQSFAGTPAAKAARRQRAAVHADRQRLRRDLAAGRGERALRAADSGGDDRRQRRRHHDDVLAVGSGPGARWHRRAVDGVVERHLDRGGDRQPSRRLDRHAGGDGDGDRPGVLHLA